ncbi:MAG: YeeE/YedE thiosulfate transporter family protein [Myxococcota bacterium]
MTAAKKCCLTTGALGILFGFALSRLGFSDYTQVHEMFTFTGFRLTLAFAAAVVVTWVGFRFWISADDFPERKVHKGSIPGGLLFGAGWALSGACPSIVWVQLGEGHLMALITLFGIGFGTWIYPRVHRRFFNWPTESCSG